MWDIPRKKYLAIVKQRKPGSKKIRLGIKEQLQYIRRNMGHIEMLLDKINLLPIPFPYKSLRKYWIIQRVYHQQEEMYRTKSKRCSDRIVSISQPHVRPIVRGKANKKVEFGAKLSVSLTGDGIARVDKISWDAYHEGRDLEAQVALLGVITFTSAFEKLFSSLYTFQFAFRIQKASLKMTF